MSSLVEQESRRMEPGMYCGMCAVTSAASFWSVESGMVKYSRTPAHSPLPEAKKTVLPALTGWAVMLASNSVTGLTDTVALESTVSCSSTNWLCSEKSSRPPEKTAACSRMLDFTWLAATSITSLSTRVVTVVRKKLKNSPTSLMTTFSPARKARRLR